MVIRTFVTRRNGDLVMPNGHLVSVPILRSQGVQISTFWADHVPLSFRAPFSLAVQSFIHAHTYGASGLYEHVDWVSERRKIAIYNSLGRLLNTEKCFFFVSVF